MPRTEYELKKWLELYHGMQFCASSVLRHVERDPELSQLPTDLPVKRSQVANDLIWLDTNPNAHIITINDREYPLQLKNIANPPVILYVLGDINLLNKSQLAVVGSRNATHLGVKRAKSLASQLSRVGQIITAGLAIGIEKAAHIGALSVAEGKTIAVLAHGFKYVYPAVHRELASNISENGCLVSEYPFDVIPLPKYFPWRNRIISGLSLGVLVIEASLKCGSLITARYAIEQGREVFAVPWSVHLPKSRGCNSLIKEGAKLVENLSDVLEELESLLNFYIRGKYAG